MTEIAMPKRTGKTVAMKEFNRLHSPMKHTKPEVNPPAKGRQPKTIIIFDELNT